MADLPTILLVSAIPLFLVFGLAQALDNRRNGVKTSLRHLLMPPILIAIVFGVGYLLTQIVLAIGIDVVRENREVFLTITYIVVAAVVLGVKRWLPHKA
jgi:hypothetical protein